MNALKQQETPPIFPLLQQNTKRVDNRDIQKLMKLEEDYKQKLAVLNQQIEQSLFKEIQEMAQDILTKTS